MEREGNIVSYTGEEIDRMLAEGGDLSDWAAVRAMTDEEIERLAEEEDGPLPENWEDTISTGNPLEYHRGLVYLDPEILDWFRAKGPGCQASLNTVLRACIEAAERRKNAPPEPQGNRRAGFQPATRSTNSLKRALASAKVTQSIACS